jgi:Protein of unknown function (DUF642)
MVIKRSAAVLLVLGAVSAHANLITNGSFENTGATFVGDANKVDILVNSTAIPGWTTNSKPTAWIENGNPYDIPASDGNFFLDLTGYADTKAGGYGGVMQSFATTAGTAYVVTFDLGYGGNSTFFSGPAIVTVSAAGATQVFTSDSGDPRPAQWNHETFDFTASAATTTLSIVGASGIDYIGVDNVDVELGASRSAVPEPGTCALLFTAMGFLGTIARLRRSSCKR